MDFLNLPHVTSALQHPHKVSFESEEMLLIHCTVSNVFVAECINGVEEEFAKIIKNLSVVRLQTSNQKLQQILIPDFKENYKCEQAVFTKSVESEELEKLELKLEKVHQSDLEFVSESYGMSEYILQLNERNRLFGYYENQTLIGYVAFHIDETVGALFVKPEFRHKGYGEKIMHGAFCLYAKKFPGKTVYSQIFSENIGSIKLHQKIGCKFATPVYWVYNAEYIYEEGIK